MKTSGWIAVLSLCAFVSRLWAGPVIGYQGMVNVAGTPFNGLGYFKFALRGPGGEGLWNHDGSPPSGAPVGVLTVQVHRGLFHVPLGDTGWHGMSPIDSLTLHQDALFVRTWFSTNGTAFEQLTPDVPLRVPDWSQFNSGNMLVAGNAGDAVSLSEALNYVRSNEWVNAIWLMPGYYQVSGGVAMPTGRWIVIRGFDKGATWIDGGEGVGIVLGQGRLQDLTVMGQPAVSDEQGSEANVEIANCELQSNSGGAPALALLGTRSHVSLRDVRLEAPRGTTLWVGGRAHVDARRCEVAMWTGRGTGVVVTANGVLTLANSIVGVGTGAAVAVIGAMDDSWVRCSDSSLNGALVISDSDNNTVELQSCRMWADSAHGAAIQVKGSGEWGELVLGQCWIDCMETPALVAQVEGEAYAQVAVQQGRIRVWNLPDGSAAIHISAQPVSYGADVQLRSSELDVYGSRANTAAIRMKMANLDASHTRIHSGNVGIDADESGIHLSFCELDAAAAGVRLANQSSLEAKWSRVVGGDGPLVGAPGVEVGVGAELVGIQSWFEGAGTGEFANGIRVLAAPAGGTPDVVLVGGGAFGYSYGVKAESGVLQLLNALVATEQGIPMEVGSVEGAPPRRVACQGTTLIRLAEGSLPALRLSGSTTPVPLLAGCMLDAPGAPAVVDAPGAPTARVLLINSVLSTNLAPNVTIQPATSSLGQGNYIR